MLRHLVPAGIRAPFAKYSHAVEVEAGARLLFCSGQLGIGLDDAIPATTEEQAIMCFEAIGRCLAEAGMGFANIVRINAYVTGREHMAPYMDVRDRYVTVPAPASTLMIVGGFTRPEFRVEVEIVAAA